VAELSGFVFVIRLIAVDCIATNNVIRTDAAVFNFFFGQSALIKNSSSWQEMLMLGINLDASTPPINTTGLTSPKSLDRNVVALMRSIIF
jgi:hypothetical protein